MQLVIMLIVMLLLLLMKGFFSGSEIALVNADKLKLNHRANLGHSGSKLVLRLFRTPEVLLTTTLVGTNLTTIILSTMGTLLVLELVHPGYSDLVAFLVFTPLFLVLGEIVPKSIYQQKSDVIAPIIVYPLRFFYFAFWPLVFLFSRVARLAVRLSGGGVAGHGMFVTREQMRSIVDMAERGANVDSFDRQRVRRAIRFAETTVGEAMVPVAEIIAIHNDSTAQAAILRIRKTGFNRLPVFEGNVSKIVGVITLSTWELLDKGLSQKSFAELVQPPYYVSELQTIDELLPILKQRRDHMAIVVDEFGATKGLITMEDIVEEVVGEIDVGYEFEEYAPRKKRQYRLIDADNQEYELDARLPINILSDLLGITLPTSEYHTAAGLVLSRLRRIPIEGDRVVESGFQFEVSEVEGPAIRRIHVCRETPSAQPSRTKRLWGKR